MSRGRLLLVAFFALALAVGVVRSLREPLGSGTPDPRPTSLNAQPDGARALFLWLREFGRPTRSWRRPLTDLSPEVEALVLIDPSQRPTAAQAESLFAWVEAGGTLFVATGGSIELDRRLEDLVVLGYDPGEASDVPGDRVVPDGGESWRYRETTPHERGMFEWPVREIAFRTGDRVSDPSGEHSILFARDDLGLVAEMWYGEGAVILFADPSMLTNRGLEKGSNIELVATLVSAWTEPGTVVRFDDWAHGLRAGGSLDAYLATRRPGLFALVLLSVSFLAVLRYGRAPVVRAAGTPRRRDPAEFVEALGGLYARARAVRPAWSATAAVANRVLKGTWPLPRVDAGERERRARELRTALALGERRRGPEEVELAGLTKALAKALRPAGNGKPGPAGGSRPEGKA